MNIRLATVADELELLRLHDQIQRQHAKAYPQVFKYPLDNKAAGIYFLHCIGSESHSVVVADDGNKLCGYLVYEKQSYQDSYVRVKGDRFDIQQIAVDSTQRRKGVGSSLFDWLDRVAEEAGGCEIRLSTMESNVGAHLFFEARGFNAYMRTYTKGRAM